MSQVLRYSRYLREIMQESAFDYSAVQVLSRWIMDAVRNAPPIFGKLILSAKRLDDVVSLSSGLGFHEIWSSMLAEKRSTIQMETLKELDILAASRGVLGSDLGESSILGLTSLKWPLIRHAPSHFPADCNANLACNSF
jgi:hypothetical protein